jgi:hypothetical protein
LLLCGNGNENQTKNEDQTKKHNGRNLKLVPETRLACIVIDLPITINVYLNFARIRANEEQNSLLANWRAQLKIHLTREAQVVIIMQAGDELSLAVFSTPSNRSSEKRDESGQPFDVFFLHPNNGHRIFDDNGGKRG